MANTQLALWRRLTEAESADPALASRPDTLAMSPGEVGLAACANILRHGHGFVAATDSGEPKDALGNWIPLFTYPCVEYLRQFDLHDKRVFEWGAGASTLYWMQRARSVTSVENNRQWFDAMSRLKNDKVSLLLEEGDGFPFRIRHESGAFDVIVIDSYGYRYDCAVEAVRKLAPGGMAILDNADWHPDSARVLRASGLLQVDFAGFKVTESHASTTSVFLKRDFNFATLQARQPTYAVGAKEILSGWDKPYAKPPAPR